MVHALQEIWRVLGPAGFLIDMRPFDKTARVEVVAGDTQHNAGITDSSHDFERHLAANAALEQLAAEGWYAREQNDSFELRSYWDSLAEFEAYYENRPGTILPPETLSGLARLLAEGGPTAKIRLRLNMIVARYRKCERG